MDSSKLVVVQTSDQRAAIESGGATDRAGREPTADAGDPTGDSGGPTDDAGDPTDDSGGPADDADDVAVLAVDELLRAAPVADYDDAYRRFRQADLPDLAGVPLYRVLWQRFAVPFNGFPDDPTGIAHLIVLYRELAERVDVDRIDSVECRGVEPAYRAVVADFADANGVERSFATGAGRHRVAGFLRGLASLLVVVLDGVLSLLWRYRYDVDASAEVVFVPHLNRFGAMEPVLEAADYDHVVVAPVSTVEWVYHRARGRWSGPAAHSPIPVGAYVSPGVLVRECSLVVRLTVAELVFARFRRGLVELIRDRFDVPLDRAVSYSLGNTYPTNLGPLPNLWLAERLYDATGAGSVVVGSLSLRQQLFLVAAERSGVDSFHVPHTVPTHYDTVPRTDTVHFVPSKSAREYHEDATFLWEGSHPVVPVGRPLLSSLASDRPAAGAVTEPIRVVIATQPFDDEIRREFVAVVLELLADSPREFDVVIKTHPVEDPAFYADFEAEYDLRVTDADLHGELEGADLTFVVNTNVGLESVALGTPTVAVNLWEPFVNSRPYQDRGPVPLFRSRDELASFVEELDPGAVEELRDEQVAFFDDQYFGDADVSAEIAAYVRDGRPADATVEA